MDQQIDMALQYRLRFDVLFIRSRLVILEEAPRMISALKKINTTSHHAKLLIEGLREVTVEEATKHIAALENTIAECEDKRLRRLEAEARLVQLYLHEVLKNLGRRSKLEVDATLGKIFKLCQSYPDTAGLLFQTYTAIKDAVLWDRHTTDSMYTRDALSTWWTWPKHQVGSLQHCRNGHPYSGATWRTGCPECGREVAQEEVVNARDRLASPADFMEAWKTSTFAAGNYR